RTRARLEWASSILRVLNFIVWMNPSVPAGSRPAFLNCAATYSAARLWPGLPVLRPSMESSASTLTCDHHLSLLAGTPPPLARAAPREDALLARAAGALSLLAGTPAPLARAAPREDALLARAAGALSLLAGARSDVADGWRTVAIKQAATMTIS